MNDFVPADHTAAIEAAAEALRFPSFGATHRDDAEAALAAAWPHLTPTIRAQIEAQQPPAPTTRTIAGDDHGRSEDHNLVACQDPRFGTYCKHCGCCQHCRGCPCEGNRGCWESGCGCGL